MSEDLIRRSDAIETAYQLRHKPNDAEWAEWLKAFNAIPSADLNAEFAEWAKLWFKKELEADRPSATEIMNAYHEGVRKGIAEAYEAYGADRPQGEWIERESVMDLGDGTFYECSNCGKQVLLSEREPHGIDFEACPYCLAKMKRFRWSGRWMTLK